MAVQAHLYSGNLALPTTICALQDWSLSPYVLGAEDVELCFGLQTTQQPQFHLNHGPQNYATGFDRNHGVYPCSSPNRFLRMASPQVLDAQLEFQRQELECILQLQNEKLKIALHEQRKQQLAVLMSSFESKTLSLMRAKEEDLAQATKKSMELQARLRKAEMESQRWQRVAKANEATIMDLKSTLEEFRERQQQQALIAKNGAEAEDAESCCFGEENRERKFACKSCKTQSSCVIFLPCRHLCSCKFCEAFLGSCPVCESTKEASMEVFLV